MQTKTQSSLIDGYFSPSFPGQDTSPQNASIEVW